jgi:DNA processing protein
VNGADGSWRRLVALTLAPGLGPVRIARLVEHLGSIDAAWLAPRDRLLAVHGLGPSAAAAVIAARGEVAAHRVDAMVRCARASGASVVTWLDDAYPQRLRGIPGSPPVVYIRGTGSRGDRPAVAIVGTRRATAYGMSIAERLGAALAARGVEVVSGLARGIDGAAHRGALRSGGRTVGVLGCGVDMVYPPEHRSLMEEMLSTGGDLIAEAPPGTPPGAGLFPARNRLISGLADAVVVVEAGADSGAMITAARAIEQGRVLFAVPGSVYAPGSDGPHRLLAAGAKVLSGPDDVLAMLHAGPRAEGAVPAPRRNAGWPFGREAVGREGLEGISSAEHRVLAAVDPGQGRSIDAVAAAARMDVASVAAAMVALEVRGAVRRVAGGGYVRDVAAPAEPNASGKWMEIGGSAWRDH